MKLSIQPALVEKTKLDVLVVGIFQGATPKDKSAETAERARPPSKRKKASASKKVLAKNAATRSKSTSLPCPASLSALNEALDGALWRAAQAEGFRGAADQRFSFHTHDKVAASRIELLGLGAEERANLDGYRGLGGRAVKAAGTRAARVAVETDLCADLSASVIAQAIAEGAQLASYRFDRYLTADKEPPALADLQLVIPGLTATESRHALQRAAAIAEGVNLARDLVNETPGTLTPVRFAAEAKAVGQLAGLDVTVFTEKELARERMGLMLAVAKASMPYTPPRMVRLAYRPAGKKAKKHIVLVGKGLTFDSGGLDIKPAAGMLEMKIDMGGAAAVLGTMLAIGKLKPGVAVTGYLGCAENGIGGNAYHPGDVITSRKGLTVEINNTDAEGRLVLADCIDYAITTDSPEVLIDLATLTGACMVALGPSTAGLFSEDHDLTEDIRLAGDRAGEDFWPLPLNAALNTQLKSSIADLKNTGERYGGAITAALFLQRFVDGRTRWAHLDIAGPCTMERDHPYTPRGGAGFGVRTLVGLIAPR